VLHLSAGQGWTGSAASEPVTLHIVQASNSPELILRRTVANANEALAANRPEEAAKIVDALLAQRPDTISLLMLRAIISARGGDLISARLCINRAMDNEDRAGAVHPSTSLYNLDQQLTAAFSAPNPQKGPYPAWATPPMPLLRILMELAEPPSKIAQSVDGSRGTSEADASTLSPTSVGANQPIKATVIPAIEITEAVIRADSAGQWASAAKAGSEYGSENYGAIQATGAPNVTSYADDSRAWASASADNQEEWLELTYINAVHATEVRIRQTFNPGAIKQIDLYDETGQMHQVWSGIDPARSAQPQIAWFAVKFAATSFSTRKVRILFDSPAVKGWNEIDAVQLVGK
jgi:hypothetical protein